MRGRAQEGRGRGPAGGRTVGGEGGCLCGPRGGGREMGACEALRTHTDLKALTSMHTQACAHAHMRALQHTRTHRGVLARAQQRLDIVLLVDLSQPPPAPPFPLRARSSGFLAPPSLGPLGAHPGARGRGLALDAPLAAHAPVEGRWCGRGGEVALPKRLGGGGGCLRGM
jgi:hypothetical protein